MYECRMYCNKEAADLWLENVQSGYITSVVPNSYLDEWDGYSPTTRKTMWMHISYEQNAIYIAVIHKILVCSCYLLLNNLNFITHSTNCMIEVVDILAPYSILRVLKHTWFHIQCCTSNLKWFLVWVNCGYICFLV